MELEMEEGNGTTVIPIQGQDSDIDLNKLAEMEYQRMKRQYFLMQRNRQSLMEKVGLKQARSLKLVKVLELQRDNLESELSAATSPLNQRKDLATKEKIWALLQIYEQYKTQVDQLSEEINKLDKTVIKITSKFYKTKLHLQSVIGCAVPTSRMERTMENHEKKLHMIKSHYDALMTENKVLKDEINLKINRRLVVFQRMEKLHKRMSEIRANIYANVDEAIQVYTAWDDAHQKILFIKEKYKEEVREHVLQMKEYDRLLFHDLRELRFYSTKNKPRSEVETAAGRDARKTELELRHLLKEVKKYQREFRKLEEYDPLQNEDTVIYNYKSIEQQNFAHFNQINDCNKEVTRLMEEIHGLKDELDNLSNERKGRKALDDHELARLETIRDMEQESLEQMKEQMQLTEDSLENILASIEAFFQAAQCSPDSLRANLGVGENLTAKDLRQAFNVLEHHIASMQLEKELLLIQKDLENRSAVQASTAKPPKVYKPSGGPFEPSMVISGRPELGMEKKEDEDDSFFAAAPIPKSVQREHLLTQLRDMGVVSRPIVTPKQEPQATYETKFERNPLLPPRETAEPYESVPENQLFVEITDPRRSIERENSADVNLSRSQAPELSPNMENDSKPAIEATVEQNFTETEGTDTGGGTSEQGARSDTEGLESEVGKSDLEETDAETDQMQRVETVMESDTEEEDVSLPVTNITEGVEGTEEEDDNTGAAGVDETDTNFGEYEEEE